MSDQSLKLEDHRGPLGAAVRRRWWLVAVFAVVLAVAGLAVGLVQKATYTATTTVLVKPVPGLPFSPDTAGTTTSQNVTMTTESALVVSDVVLKAASAKLGTAITPGSGAVAATVPANTQTIQVSYTAGSAAKAQKGADTLAQSFLDYRGKQATEVTQGKIKTLQASIASNQAQLDLASKAASAAVPLPQAAGLVTLYSSTLVQLQQTLSTTQATSLNPGSVIAPAVLPESTRALTAALFGLAGLVLGALLGALAAVVAAMRDRRLRGGESHVAGLPVIASVAHDRDFGTLVDRVRTAVLAGSALPVTVGVLSTDAAAALQLTSSLSDSLAVAGYRVAMVEADPESPSFEIGLGELLTRSSHAPTGLELREAVFSLPAGRELAASADLLSGPRMAQIVADLHGSYDVVLISLPSATSTLGLATARLVDETVLLAPVNRTSSDTVVDLVRQSDLLGVRLLGLVIGPDRPSATSRRATPPLAPVDDHEPKRHGASSAR